VEIKISKLLQQQSHSDQAHMESLTRLIELRKYYWIHWIQRIWVHVYIQCENQI